MATLHLARKLKVISDSGTENYSLCYMEFNTSVKELSYRIFPFDRERQDAIYHDRTLLLDLTGSKAVLREE